MPQNVNIIIAGQEFNLTANSPQQEQDMRVAAEALNTRLRELDSAYAGGTPVSKLAFVALGEAVRRVGYQRAFESLKAESEDLDRQMEAYLLNK